MFACNQVLLGMALAQISWLPRESHLVIPHLIGFNTGAKNENRNQNIYAIKNVRSNVSIYIYICHLYTYIYIYAIYIYIYILPGDVSETMSE